MIFAGGFADKKQLAILSLFNLNYNIINLHEIFLLAWLSNIGFNWRNPIWLKSILSGQSISGDMQGH